MILCGKRKFLVVICFAILVMLVLGVGCRGFFVNPKLSSLTVGPANQSIAPGRTLQMSATGTFDDGSTSDITGKSIWASSDTSVATVGATNGLVKAAATIANPPGTATITATDGTISNTATVTVCPTVTNLTLTTPTSTAANGDTVTFTVKGTFSGSSSQQDVTDNVSWNISDTTVIPSISNGSGVVSSSANSGSSTSVTASLCGGTSNSVTITVQ